ncbi:beta-lactam antibiotic acylase [Alicyclobacillus contaminans]|nr:beta-lactam antibiotic acylase [Alicyclobacillus contaminans]
MVAVIFSGGVLWLAGRGIGPLPALGPAFNAGTGVWTMAKTAQPPTTETLHFQFLHHPATVKFDEHGIAYIHASDDHDLFAMMGYLHTEFRLTQMDLMRRQGEGRLAEVVGKKALPSDEFELQLGLQRTAEQEWQQMDKSSAAGQALLAYAEGVNEKMDEDKRSGELPYTFKLMGYSPQPWTPVDSLVIQGIMTQTLDYTDTPLDYALLVKSLGSERTMDWFPTVPKNEQHPYDPGPYVPAGAKPIQAVQNVSADEAAAVADIQQRMRALPVNAVHTGSNSNNWAVDGTKTASGEPLMAGDPHLSQTLPSIWYQVQASSPNYEFAGVSIPGMPCILIGHNDHISWSLTNVQNQATFFYTEKTDASHPNQYFWNGAWHPYQQISYDIPVKGGNTAHFTVQLTVHGPVLTSKGQTVSVNWIGAKPSPDLAVLLRVIQSNNFQQFRNALKDWRAPSQNFVYADDRGNIGLISAGEYPIVKHGNPWLPLPGTGASDIQGSIPFDDIPQVYDPPSHFVFSANQREVSADYPYYIGTSLDFFSDGFRADEIYRTLSAGKKLTVKDMEALQNDTTDYLATTIVPKLTASLAKQSLNSTEQQALHLLTTWNDRMDPDSSAAAIWWTFWTDYLSATFQPWWDAAKVPVDVDPTLKIRPNLTSLNEDLQAWTLTHPTNPAFSLPDGTKRTADDVMFTAFRTAVAHLSKRLGSDPKLWSWGALHSRQFPSLLQVPALGYGPFPSGGDDWTVNAADSDNGYLSTGGPSWRFVMDWGTGNVYGVYPGGQSENPLSPWYENFIDAWWNGAYYPLLEADQVSAKGTWTMVPDTDNQGGGARASQ